MTVQELIDKLKEFPATRRIFVYEYDTYVGDIYHTPRVVLGSSNTVLIKPK